MTYGKMLLGVAAAALMSGTALAQTAPDTKATNVSASTAAPTPQAMGVEHAALAATLASYGRSSNDPVALMVAGQIQASVGATDKPREKTSDGDGVAGTPAAKSGTGVALTPAALFAEARTLAGSDKALVAQIDRAAARQSKGAVNGPVRHFDSVNAQTNDWYTIAFRAGESARVAAIGDGDTDLDLRVYDANGNLVCSDTDATDRTVCGWTPAWTGTFRVKISNLGNVYNRYTLLTN